MSARPAVGILASIVSDVSPSVTVDSEDDDAVSTAPSVESIQEVGEVRTVEFSKAVGLSLV